MDAHIPIHDIHRYSYSLMNVLTGQTHRRFAALLKHRARVAVAAVAAASLVAALAHTLGPRALVT